MQERIEETLARRTERKAFAASSAAPDLSSLPGYHALKSGNTGWLTELTKRPHTMPGYFDAEDAGFGSNLLAHGPFDTDRFTGQPLVTTRDAGFRAEAKVEAKAEAKEGGRDDGGGAHSRGGGGGNNLWCAEAKSEGRSYRDHKHGGGDGRSHYNAQAMGDGWIED